MLELLDAAERLAEEVARSDLDENLLEQRKRKTPEEGTQQPEDCNISVVPPIYQRSIAQAPVWDRLLLKENTVPLYRPKKPNKVKFQHYIYILNDTIKSFNGHLHGKASIKFDDLGPIWGSNIASSYWTPIEKNTFFNAVSRFTKRNLYAVARTVATKSPMECQQYMDALEDGMDILINGEYYKESESNRCIFHPAAREVSKEWLKMETMCATHAVRELEFETDEKLTEFDTPTLNTTYTEEDQRTAKGIWAFDALIDLNATLNMAQAIYKMPKNAEVIHNVLPLMEERRIKRRKMEAGQPLLYTQLIEALTEEARWITGQILKVTCLIANKRMFCQAPDRIVLKEDVEKALALLGSAAQPLISSPSASNSTSSADGLDMEADTVAYVDSEIEGDDTHIINDEAANNAREEYMTVIDENRDIEADEFYIDYLSATSLGGLVKFPDETASILPEPFGRNQP